MAKTEPLTVRFSPQEYELLSRVAEVEDRSRGSVVRRLVDSSTCHRTTSPMTGWRTTTSRASAGQFDSWCVQPTCSWNATDAVSPIWAMRGAMPQ